MPCLFVISLYLCTTEWSFPGANKGNTTSSQTWINAGVLTGARENFIKHGFYQQHLASSWSSSIEYSGRHVTGVGNSGLLLGRKATRNALT